MSAANEGDRPHALPCPRAGAYHATYLRSRVSVGVNIVATALAPALVVGVAAFLLVGPAAGAVGAVCGVALGAAVALCESHEAEAGRSGPAPEVRDARVE